MRQAWSRLSADEKRVAYQAHTNDQVRRDERWLDEHVENILKNCDMHEANALRFTRALGIPTDDELVATATADAAESARRSAEYARHAARYAFVSVLLFLVALAAFVLDWLKSFGATEP